MRHLFYITALAVALCSAASCAKKQSANSVKAQAQAVEAVNRIVDIDSTDTMALQNELLRAEALRSQYTIDGDSIAAQDFDQTFREALIQKAPQMAKTLFSKNED